MKKFGVILLIAVFCFSLCACGEKFDPKDYVGTWFSESWTNETTGISSTVTLQLNDNNTFQRETIFSDGKIQKCEGTWEIEDDAIIASVQKVLAGELLGYDKNGNLEPGVGPANYKYTIDDDKTLTSGSRIYNKK